MSRPGQGKKVLVAMSGGVDSSVAAALLQDDGYEIVGCFMRLGSDDSIEGPDELSCDPAKVKIGHQGCCSVNDASDARLVAAMLDVPFYVMNFRKDFGRIIDYFVDEYNAGRTPNPCVRCNEWLKFGKLLSYARSIDADFVATGHYARIDHHGPQPRLLQGVYKPKDQSYVLFGVGRENLSHMLLPIGGLDKPIVRQIAEDRRLPVFNKPDSQEICFVPDNNYMRLVRNRSGDRIEPGLIVDTAGRTLGQHDGHQQFTIGQRRGLSVSLGHPIYVVDKDPQSNTVVVGEREHTFFTGLSAAETTWLIDPPVGWSDCDVKIRSQGEPFAGRVRITGDDSFEVHFHQPHQAVSPGQAVVCYHGEQVIAGGWIRKGTRPID